MGKKSARGLGFKRWSHSDPERALRSLDEIDDAIRRARPPLEELSEFLGVTVEDISVHVPGLRDGRGRPVRMSPGWWLISFSVAGTKHAVRVRVKSAWLRSPGYLTQLARNVGRDPALPAFATADCRRAVRLLYEHIERIEAEENGQ